MKIAVYAIALNEAKHVDRFAESAADADYLVVADTGSTDGTVRALRDHTDTVYQTSVQPWRFDHARNASLALVPADADICICLDMDEVLEPGWRDNLLRAWKPGTTRLSYKFDWSSGVVFYSDKIHSRNGYAWHHPCHELLHPDPRLVEQVSVCHELLISHHPDNSKSRGSYLDLLAVGAKEDPTCPRNTIYYGRELMLRGRADEGVAELTRYLGLPGATWAAERAYAMRLIGAARQSERWLLNSCAEDPSSRDSWYALALYYSGQCAWADCAHACARAMKTLRQYNYMDDPELWTYKLFDLAALAAHYSGDRVKAIEYGTAACQANRGEQRLLDNLVWYRHGAQ